MFGKNRLFVLLFFLIIAAGVIYLIGKKDSQIYYEANPSELAKNYENLKNNDVITNQRRNIITETVANSSSAVVGINVTEIRQFRDPFFSPFFDDSFFRQFFGDRTYQKKVKSLGSGFLISPDGYIITNDHVAGNASEIVVTLTNGKHYNAKLIGSDPVSDICLIKIDDTGLPFLPLGNSDDVIIGEWVIALGNPFGLFDINDKPTVTVGVVSATNMNLDPVQNRYYLNMIQTDAAINGGNSGGPLLNSLGEVIAMNTLIYTAGGIQGNIGLGFGIPINKVKKIAEELKDKGKIERDFYTGLRIQNIDDTIQKYFNLDTQKGVIITRVDKNSPADKAGLEQGDVIIQINEFRINNEQTLIGVFQEFRTNQTVNVKILRNKEELIKKMKLESR